MRNPDKPSQEELVPALSFQTSERTRLILQIVIQGFVGMNYWRSGRIFRGFFTTMAATAVICQLFYPLILLALVVCIVIALKGENPQVTIFSMLAIMLGSGTILLGPVVLLALPVLVIQVVMELRNVDEILRQAQDR